MHMKKEELNYREKIEIIFSNRLESNGDNEKVINDVLTWLRCEWQCSDMSMDEYVQLRDMVGPIARRMIKEL